MRCDLLFGCDHAARLLHDDVGFGVERGFPLTGLGLFDQYMITRDEVERLGVTFRVCRVLHLLLADLVVLHRWGM